MYIGVDGNCRGSTDVKEPAISGRVNLHELRICAIPCFIN